MCPTEIGGESAGWTELAQYWDKWRAVVGAVMKLRVLWDAADFLNSWGRTPLNKQSVSSIPQLKLVSWSQPASLQYVALESLLHTAGRSSCSSYLGYWLKSFWLPWQPDPYRGKHIVTCCNPHRQTDGQRQKVNSAAGRDITGEGAWIAWHAN